ncbi:MAG TPA: RHS repeat-associated core domain-containing protein, partial [Cytophagales bacterium]|nr:RHS repeat-associated core domain-containing protein [Cytophagales bacterium]
ATVTDKRFRLTTSGWVADVPSATDYYAFGSSLKSAGTYRYGFNGKEKDDEGMGGGQSTYDYGFRIYNPNLGKFLSVDPLTGTYSELTPYQFASNIPISCIDLDGLEAWYTADGKLSGSSGPFSNEYAKSNKLVTYTAVKDNASSPRLVMKPAPNKPTPNYMTTLPLTGAGVKVVSETVKAGAGRKVVSEIAKKAAGSYFSAILSSPLFRGNFVFLMLAGPDAGVGSTPSPEMSLRQITSDKSLYTDEYLAEVEKRISDGTATANERQLLDEISRRKAQKEPRSDIDALRYSLERDNKKPDRVLDCSDIASGYNNVYSGGRVLEITPIKGKLNGMEYGQKVEDFEFHDVYERDGYIYDPMFSDKPVKTEDYLNKYMEMNPNGIKVQTIK